MDSTSTIHPTPSRTSRSPDPSPSLAPRSDQYDAIAHLFLGEIEPDRSPSDSPSPSLSPSDSPSLAASAPAPTSTPTLEGLVVSHLASGALDAARSYAASLASARRLPVGILSLVEPACRVYACSADPASIPDFDAAPPRSVHDALRRLAPHIRHWVFLPDPHSEAALGSTIDADAVTIIAAPDSDSISAAFRSVRTMFVAGLGRRTAADSKPRCDVRLVTLGESDAAAKSAADRFCSAASLLLGLPVRNHIRLDPTAPSALSVMIFDGPRESPAAEIPAELLHLRSSFSPPQVVPPARDAAMPAPMPLMNASLSQPGLRTSPPESRPLRTSLSPPPDGLHAPTPQFLESLESTLLLAASVPGLRPIQARCPYAPSLVLSLDPRGCFHLLLEVADVGDRASDEFEKVSRWLSDHAELIRLTLPPGTALDPAAEFIRHVFVSTGRGVSALLRKGMRVHVAIDDRDRAASRRYVEIS
ncbi:MAG: hypothetical protein AB7G11_16160 [Phycisphaerales bacterium]